MAANAWRRPETVELAITAILGPSQPSSGSRAFPVLASDERRWYVKVLNNPQGGQILVTEYLISGVGAMIGAPVCEVRPIAIPEDLGGYQVPDGPRLEVGIASASLAIADVAEMRPTLQHRESDDNARRHAGIYAIFDWCWGDDPQWLQVATDDHRAYSHDHGFYLPPGGQSWTRDSLANNVNIPHPLSTEGNGLDHQELERLASALRDLGDDDFEQLLAGVPASWPASDLDLEEVRRYLVIRAPQVAGRLDELRSTN